MEDFLVKVDKFYYPVDFVVLDTEPIAIEPNHVPIIQGIPFLATSNAIINCWNGVMQLTFGNMTLELNIFHLSNKHKQAEGERQEVDEVCSIGPSARNPKSHKLQAELVQKNEAIGGEWTAPVTPAEPMICPTSPSEKKLNTKEPSMEAYAAHITEGVKFELVWSPLRSNCSSKILVFSLIWSIFSLFLFLVIFFTLILAKYKNFNF